MREIAIGHAARGLARAAACAAALGCAAPALAQESSPAPNVGWPNYNNDLQGQRYSPLKQINAGNVAQMHEVCRVKLQDGGTFQNGPIVVNGVMYVTTVRDTVALDPRDCREIWRSKYTSAHEDVFPVNRGAAYMNGRLYRGTADGKLLAIDAASGKILWENIVGDPDRGEFLSAAPLAWNGVVYVGTAGSDWGARGRVLAFDAGTGRELWRFHLIPTGDEPGADSWKSAKSTITGGGGSWAALTLDISAGELFVPVGNPAPDLDPSYRPGDNLYTDSVVVLDARTGKLKWYHQLKAHDALDHDVGAAPTLFRSPDVQDIVAIASKDGHVVGVDRETHRQLYRTPVTTIENEGGVPTEQGMHACPGLVGGVEWNGTAYDRTRNSLYVGAVDWCATFKKGKPKYIAGQFFFGGDPNFDDADRASGWVTALDAVTGKEQWKYHAQKPVVSGITPTAGGVVFAGDTGGTFFALDSATGKPLYTLPTQGMVAGGVVTYAVDGKQYVAFTSGNVSRITFGGLGDPSIIVLGLPDQKRADLGR